MFGIYYFDLAAIFIVIALIVAVLIKKMYVNNSSKIYIILISVLLITSIFDAASCFPTVLNEATLNVATTFYHLFRNILLVVYLLYVLSICELERILIQKKYLIIIGLIPIVFIFLLIITNPFTHFIFYYDYIDSSGNPTEIIEYHRSIGMAFIYVNSVIYLGLTLFVIIKYRKLFNIREIISICAIFPLTLISLIIQFFNKGLLIEMFASTLSAVLISIAIERTDDHIDENFLIGTKKAFVKDLKKSFLFKSHLFVLVIKISNYYEIYDVYNYADAIQYVRNLALNYEKKYKTIDKSFKCFYVGNGLFAISLSTNKNIDKISNEIKDDFIKIRHSRTKFVPDSQLVIIDTLNDFKDYNDIIFFLNNYNNMLHFDGDIVKLGDVKEDRTFKIVSNVDTIIDNALKNGEFEVFYQPIYNVKKNEFHSAEALVRLNSKEYGYIAPGLFIPRAEKTGKVTEIDQYVFEEVCKFIASPIFKKIGLKYIEVNLSMIDCVSPYLYPRIVYFVEKYGVRPEQINIEITESYDTLNRMLAKDNIDKLRKYGFTFSLDDYGTGYSNLERFALLPITYVKIDKSIVDSSDDKKMQIVIKNTFDFIKSLKRKTIIEGIETKEQADRFISLDCDNIQGYYYSKPLSNKDFINFVSENNKKLG